MIGVHTGTGYGEGLLAFEQLREMIWRCIEIGAVMFIAGAALWFICMLFCGRKP